MAPKKQSRNGASASARRTSRSSARSSSRTASTRSPSRGPAILLISVVVLVVSAWAFYPVARVQYQEERNRARLEAELDGLKARNAELRAQVDRLKTPEGVEQVAREDLGMVKEGENLYVVMDPASGAATAAPTGEGAESDSDVWLGVLDAIFGFEE